MDKVIVDAATLERLAKLDHGVQICDQSGRTIGWFQPSITADEYDGLTPPFSEEELRRAEQEEGGRTLAEILADLGRRR